MNLCLNIINKSEIKLKNPITEIKLYPFIIDPPKIFLNKEIISAGSFKYALVKSMLLASSFVISQRVMIKKILHSPTNIITQIRHNQLKNFAAEF